MLKLSVGLLALSCVVPFCPAGERLSSVHPTAYFGSLAGVSGEFFAHYGRDTFGFDARGGMRLSLPGSSPDEAPIAISMTLVGSNPRSTARLLRPLHGKTNFLVGEAASWRTNVEIYGQLLFSDVYAGVDVSYRGSAQGLEYDFCLAPYADPSVVQLAFAGVDRLHIERNGDLTLKSGLAEWRHHRPRVYQTSAGLRREISGRYVLAGRNSVRFSVGTYNHALPLLIDPEVTVFRYIGGGSDDRGYAVAVDGTGSTYIAGEAWSPLLASSGSYQPALRGGPDVLITKVRADGSIEYATYIGGRARDSGQSIAVDTAGNAYVTGFTYSRDFPTTAGALQRSSAAYPAAFVSKLNPAGNALLYSTFVGGSGADFGEAIAVNSAGSAVVAGYTSSQDFPTSGAASQSKYGGGFYDAFVAKLDTSGGRMVFASYIGGSATDVAAGVAVDAQDNVYVAGSSSSADFPRKNSASPATQGTDVFVSKLTSAGDFIYSSTWGGRGYDVAWAIAVDGAGAAYVAGSTGSPDMPSTLGVYQPSLRGDYDAFVTKLSPLGPVVFTTYLGGAMSEEARGIALDTFGHICVAGWTTSADFPGQTSAAVDRDAFFAELSADGSGLAYATLIGGSATDTALGLAIDQFGIASLTGYTLSSNVRLATGRVYGAFGGSVDAFLARINLALQLPPAAVSVVPASGSGSTQTFSFLLSDPAGYANIAGSLIVINNGLDGNNGCYLSYDRRSGSIALYNDVTVSFVAIQVGTSQTVHNNQCSVTGSSASFTGNSATLNLTLTFTPSFSGTKAVYLMAQNLAGLTSGWVLLGSWTVPNSGPPAAVSVSPSSGAGNSQSFTFTFSDPAGYANIGGALIVINGGLDGNNGCYLAYDRNAGSVALYDDASARFVAATVGGSQAIQNTQCAVTNSSASFSGNNAQLNLTIAFRPAFTGTKNIYMTVQSATGLTSGWALRGSWTASSSGPPSALSVSPPAGSGSTQSFSFVFSDPAGNASVAWGLIVINAGLDGNNGCYFSYDRGGGVVSLYNDATARFVSAPVGASQVLQNPQCSITNTSASFSGNTATVNLSITFGPAFRGAKNIYMMAQNVAGLTSAWALRGSWNVP